MIKQSLATARTLLSLLFIGLLLYACAQRGRPDGGPEDVDPPQIVVERPPNFSTLFNKDEIRIFFDEFVKLDKPRNQIIFSPPIEPRPNVTPMGLPAKYVGIELDLDSLQPNTTYTINFGLSIEDNNEGNKFPFYKYVFSTGDYIDSLSVQGKIYDPMKRVADEFVSILLYAVDTTYTDSIVFKKNPTYITYTVDSTNFFSLDNLKEGKYKLVALSDKATTYRFAPSQDKIGFFNDTIQLPEDDLRFFEMPIFKEILDFKPDRPKQDKRNRIMFGYTGNITAENYDIQMLSEAPKDFSYSVVKDEKTDSLYYWYKPFMEVDSLLFTFNNGTLAKLDTLKIYPKELEKDSLVIEEKVKGSIKIKEDFYLTSRVPIVAFEKDSIHLMRVPDSIALPFEAELDKFNNHFKIKFEKEEETAYELKMFPGAITSFFDETNDTLKVKLKTPKNSQYGNLVLTIQNMKEGPKIIQLVTLKDEVKYEQFAERREVFEFNLLDPGEYYVRVVYDTNNNKRWDTGHYLKKQQPEKVVYFPMPFTVRSNWDYTEVIRLP